MKLSRFQKEVLDRCRQIRYGLVTEKMYEEYTYFNEKGQRVINIEKVWQATANDAIRERG